MYKKEGAKLINYLIMKNFKMLLVLFCFAAFSLSSCSKSKSDLEKKQKLEEEAPVLIDSTVTPLPIMASDIV